MKTSLKIFAALLVFIIITQKSFSQAPTWQWAHNAGDHGDEGAFGTAMDASGNIYVTGWYTSSFITFGAVTLLNTSAGTADFFVTKYDPTGTVLWSKNFGGVDGDDGNGIAVDASGNVYITGWYSSPTLAFGTTTLTNSGSPSSDIFIAKLNSAGTVQWAKSYGGSTGDRGYGIALDPSGNIYTTGGFSSSSVNFGSTVLTNAGTTNDFFISKHDSNGNELWAKNAGGTSSDAGFSVATDSLGNAYVTGMFSSSSINFGNGTLTGAGAQDLFIVKYNGSGTAAWSYYTGGSMDDFGNGIAVKKGNVYVTGGFNSSSVKFGTFILTNTFAGTSDMLLAKCDLSGNFVWARSAGGADSEEGNGIACDANSNVYVSGYFISNSVTFGGNTVASSATTSREIFVAAYSSAGNGGWAVGATGGSYDDTGNSIAVNPAGTDIYVGGIFNSGALTFGTNTIFKGCGNDVFVAKLSGPNFVGIKEELSKEQLLMYPNPTTGKFMVKAKGEIFVYNAIGEIILEQKLDGDDQVDISAQPKGVYMIRIISDKKTEHTGKIVLK